MLILLLQVTVLLLFILDICDGFAAGGGGGGFGKTTSTKKSKNNNNKKQQRNNNNNNNKKGFVNVDIPNNNNRKETNKQHHVDDTVKLDKWGLPPPSEDDIFPPMPIGTELISAQKEYHYTLDEIKQHLTNVLPLNLSRFHDNKEDASVETFDNNNGNNNNNKMKLKLVHVSPPVLIIENFLTKKECEQVESVIIHNDDDDYNAPVQVNSKTFANAISTRTSTSWFCYYKSIPTILCKMKHVLGLNVNHFEEPQIVRYQSGQEFSWHYDEVPINNLNNGGQRLGTFLIYLNTVKNDGGGGTIFRDLKDSNKQQLCVQPKQGNAILFFPSNKYGIPDDRTLHKGEKILKDGYEKRICQIWIHEREYNAVVPPNNFQQDAIPFIEKIST